jgi:threonylcarbamoyladenosine tRNA methylthiotransferase MtaB
MSEVITFGCRLNTVESETMKRLADEAGLTNTIIINSCAVTAEATRQARQTIRRLKREQPDARIIVTGCAAQAEPEMFAEMTEVFQVIGNDRKLTLDVWQETSRLGLDISREEKVRVNDIFAVKEQALHLVDGLTGRARAFVQVQNGCDHRCTFCIIPFGRGNSRSVALGEVVTQIRLLVENNYKEVVLTGVDLTSYGHDLPGTPTLGALVKAILKHVPELPRLRISSIDSIEADEDLIDAMASSERLMPHLHLSLQAGDNMILKRMKRRHAREDAILLTKRLKQLRPDIVFGADIIAGFPTETEEMFEQSLRLVDECDLTFLHVFPFSPRKGTPAARMPQVGRQISKERASRLRLKGDIALQAHLHSLIGREFEVLSESDNISRTPGFAEIKHHVPVEASKLFKVRVTGVEGNRAVV